MCKLTSCLTCDFHSQSKNCSTSRWQCSPTSLMNSSPSLMMTSTNPRRRDAPCTCCVSQSKIGKFAQAMVLTFFLDFAEFVTVGHAVKHWLKIAAIQLEFAESESVRYVGRIFARNVTRFLREDGNFSLSDPRFLRKFFVLAQTLIVRR